MENEVLVRFSNESVYQTFIKINFEKVEKILIFPNEVFFTIDDVRVSVKREDWDEIQKKMLENTK